MLIADRILVEMWINLKSVILRRLKATKSLRQLLKHKGAIMNVKSFTSPPWIRLISARIVSLYIRKRIIIPFILVK